MLFHRIKHGDDDLTRNSTINKWWVLLQTWFREILHEFLYHLMSNVLIQLFYLYKMTQNQIKRVIDIITFVYDSISLPVDQHHLYHTVLLSVIHSSLSVCWSFIVSWIIAHYLLLMAILKQVKCKVICTPGTSWTLKHQLRLIADTSTGEDCSQTST